MENGKQIQGIIVKCSCGVRRIIPADGDYILQGQYICTHCGKMMKAEIVRFEKDG